MAPSGRQTLGKVPRTHRLERLTGGRTDRAVVRHGHGTTLAALIAIVANEAINTPAAAG
jgi:hypothetical protein